MKKRVVYCITQNPKKIEEYARILSKYGIKVIQTNEVSESTLRLEDYKVLCIIRETSDIYNINNGLLSTKMHLEVVKNISTLNVYYLENNIFSHKTYRNEVEGYIDLTKRLNKEEVFGWDDIFIGKQTQMSLHEMKNMGMKLSARDLVFADFIKDFIYYRNRIDLNFNPQQQNETIDFNNSVISFISNNTYLNNPIVSFYKLDSLIQKSLSNGLFFKSAKNRREKNYWFPGLNAGLPLVPKKDSIHEITFMFHDIMHFLIPDLLCVEEKSPLYKKVYIIYRMMSEAITLCLADMLFVDTLTKIKPDYDFSKRDIYPLFTDLNLDFKNQYGKSLKLLLYANVKFALAGDDSYFKALYKHTDYTNLYNYQKKYKKFFVEDYKWTENNYNHMSENSGYLSKWLDAISQIDGIPKKFKTVHDFVHDNNIIDNNSDYLIEIIFEIIFYDILLKAINNPIEVNEQSFLSTSFIRYMAGQFGVFAKYHFIPETSVYKEKIIDYLNTKNKNISLFDIKIIREYYNQYIDLLYEKNYISQDDQSTFKEIYMLFDPFYVFYDESDDYYQEISDVKYKILGD